MRELLTKRDDKTGRVSFDALMQVALHFRDAYITEQVSADVSHSVPPIYLRLFLYTICI